MKQTGLIAKASAAKNILTAPLLLLSVLWFTPCSVYAQKLSFTHRYASVDSIKKITDNPLFADNKSRAKIPTHAEEITSEAKDEQLFSDLEVSISKRADRKALMATLQTLKVTNTSTALAAKSKLYYRVANVFVHLRLYPLAMKCFLKTMPATINAPADTLRYLSKVNDTTDRTYIDQSYLTINSSDDSVLNKQPEVLATIETTDEKSAPIAYQRIINTFDDGKKAAGYALLFHVKQPVPGKPKIYVGANTGHTFITLIKYNVDSSYVSLSFGFYPKKRNLLSATPLVPATTSVFKNDSKHRSDEIVGKFISKRRFDKILLLTKQYSGLEYHLSKNNCTDFGIKAAGLAGISIDNTFGKWPLGKGNNPAITGQSILQGKFTNADQDKINSLFVNTINNTN